MPQASRRHRLLLPRLLLHQLYGDDDRLRRDPECIFGCAAPVGDRLHLPDRHRLVLFDRHPAGLAAGQGLSERAGGRSLCAARAPPSGAVLPGLRLRRDRRVGVPDAGRAEHLFRRRRVARGARAGTRSEDFKTDVPALAADAMSSRILELAGLRHPQCVECWR